jgi:hypothetical protein
VIAGGGHDLILGRGVLAFAVATQVGDQGFAAVGFAGGGDGDDADGGAVVFEGDLGVRHGAGRGPDVGGDGDLTLGI